MEVHGTLGEGFLEAVYQEALALEFAARQIPFKREVQVPIYYKGRKLELFYKADFICYEDLLVELKALSELPGAAEAQVINYLKGTGLNRAILLNFGAKSLQHKRLVRDYHLEEWVDHATTADFHAPAQTR